MTEQRHAADQGVPEFRLDDAQPQGRHKLGATARRTAIVIALLLAAGLGRTLWVRHADAQQQAETAAQNAVLAVEVTAPTANDHNAQLRLPGTLQGFSETPVYARTGGYVRKWLKDIGQPVKKGDLLAILEIPEIDRQVDEAHANFKLASAAYQRWHRLREQDAVSQQELDEKTALYQQTSATLKRLQEQQGFARIVAPFDGIVTRRNVDNGTLVNAGNGGNAQALFTVATVDTLRLYVYVPQARAAAVHAGDTVDVQCADQSCPAVAARVLRTADAIDPATSTLQVLIEVPNARRQLLPGMFVEATFKLPAATGMTVAANTLVFNADGAQVALAGPNGQIKMQPVVIGIDYGRDVEIKSGLDATDRLVVNPPDSIRNGLPYKIVRTTGAVAPTPASAPGASR